MAENKVNPTEIGKISSEMIWTILQSGCSLTLKPVTNIDGQSIQVILEGLAGETVSHVVSGTELEIIDHILESMLHTVLAKSSERADLET